MSNKVSLDPFSIAADDSTTDGCFQTWADERNISKYPVLDLEKGERKCYPSPKEKKSFLERMKDRDEKQTRMRFSPKSVRNQFQNKGIPKVVKKDSIEELNVSPKMKKFIQKEFRREKLKYNFLPEKQVKLQVIHRYKVHIRNSEMKMPKTKKVVIHKTKSKPGKISKFRKIRRGNKEENSDDEDENKDKNEAQSSTDTQKKSMHFNKNCLEDSEDDDSLIEDFDDANLHVSPAPGAFQICPNKRQRSDVKQLLVCYHADSDTDAIVDSSQEIEHKTSPVKFYKDITKEGSPSPSPRKRVPKLPYLLSSSPNTEARNVRLASGGKEGTIDDNDVKEIDKNIEMQFLRFELCYSCLTRKDDLLFCSGCNKAAYCNQVCQLNDWTFHRKFCRKMKSDIEISSEETEQILLAHLNNAVKLYKKKEAMEHEDKEHIPKNRKSLKLSKKSSNIETDTADDDNVKKSVKFLSQPEFESEAKPKFQKTPAKSILKRKTKQSVVEKDRLREEENGNVQIELIEDVGKEEIQSKPGKALDENNMETKSEGEISTHSDLDKESFQYEEIEDEICDNMFMDNVGKESMESLKEFPNNDKDPNDAGSPSAAGRLVSSTPENSPQTLSKIQSIGAFAPKSSGKRSVSRLSRTNPKQINSNGKPIKLFDNLEEEHEEFEISINQNEEENRQIELYLPIPKKLLFEDIDEDSAGQSNNERLDNSELGQLILLGQIEESLSVSKDESLDDSEVDLQASFLSASTISSVDLIFGEEDELKRKSLLDNEHNLSTTDVEKNDEVSRSSSLDMFDDEEVADSDNEIPNAQPPVMNLKVPPPIDVVHNSESGQSSSGFLGEMFISDEEEAEKVDSSGGSSSGEDMFL